MSTVTAYQFNAPIEQLTETAKMRLKSAASSPMVPFIHRGVCSYAPDNVQLRSVVE
jgi:hypothetical protein